MYEFYPIKIARQGEAGLEISWNDGKQDCLSSKLLRENCPSAVSKAQRGDTSHEKPISNKPSLLKIVEASSKEELSLQKVWGIGNYAIGIEWADGHNTGIYTFDFLRKLGESRNSNS
ncbi:MAG: DUF971 domain-containing protein [Bdellovibrionales bacterium]|nr:DUF971 domain-containing protein [Bdellovibrionales bacterium]